MEERNKNSGFIIVIYSTVILLSLFLFRLGEVSIFYSSSVSLIIIGIALFAFTVGWFMSRSSADTVIDYRVIHRYNISRREYEVLQHLSENLSNKAIADKLYISESAVKKHISSLLKKVSAPNREILIQEAKIKGLLLKK